MRFCDRLHAVVLPGGQVNPDLLRVEPKALKFIKDIFDAKKVVAAVCHAPWLETGIAKGRKMTSYKSIKTDVANAGAKCEDSEVVVDEGVMQSGRLGGFQRQDHRRDQGRPPYPAQRGLTAMKTAKIAGDAGAETRVAILETGEEAFSALTKAANDAGITAASLTVIGAFQSAVVGLVRFREEDLQENRDRRTVRSLERDRQHCRRRRQQCQPSRSCCSRPVRRHDARRAPSRRQGPAHAGGRLNGYPPLN